MEWFNSNSGLAAWIQAIGIIGSVWVVFYVSRLDAARRSDQELNRAKGLITQLKTALEQFRLKVIDAEKAPLEIKKIWLSNKIMRRSREFPLLGGVGNQLDSLVVQVNNLNRSMAALPTEQPYDREQRLQAEADIKDDLSSCHELLDSILEEMKEIELSAQKPFVVRRIIVATQRLFRSSPLRMKRDRHHSRAPSTGLAIPGTIAQPVLRGP
jgi:hypothetical protein